MFNFALALFLLLSPILVIPFNGFIAQFQWYQFGYFKPSVSLLQILFLQYGTLLLFVLALFSKVKRKFDNKYLGLLFLAYFLSLFNHPKTIVNLSMIIPGFILYYLTVSYSGKKKLFYWVIFLVSALNTIFAILQFFNIHLIYFPKDEIVGLMNYKTQLGIYQALAIPIAYSLNPLLALIPTLGLLLSKSSTAIVSAFVGLAYLFRLKLKQLYIPLGILIIYSIQHSLAHKFYLRWVVWKETLSLIIKDISGYGAGTFNYVSKSIDNVPIKFDEPYSIYLGVTYALGILGLAALIFFIKDSFRGVISRELVSACLILAVAGLGYSLFDYPRLAGTTVILFGLLNAEKNGGLSC